MVTMQEIRENYPFPVSIDEHKDQNDYCVGGAVCLFSNLSQRRFPARWELSETLLRLNRFLPHTTSWDFADKILTANDKRNFDLAWRLVEKALKQGRI